MSARFQSNADRIASPQVRSIPFHLALAFLSMLLLGLAFPSPGWWPLAHIALVPMTLMASWADRAKRLFWTSYIASYAWWLIMLGWLIGVTGGGYAALAAYMALYYSVYLILWRLIDRRFRWPAAITVPLVFVSLEYIRGTFLQGGMAWFGLGHSQAPYLPSHGNRWLIQVADLAGDWTISFVVAVSNGFVVDLFRCLHLPSHTRLRKAMPATFIWLAIFGGALFYGARSTSDPSTNTVTVAVIQTNVSQSNKENPTTETMIADWLHLIGLTKQAIAQNPKPSIIVWPETIVPYPLNREVRAIYEQMRADGTGGDQLLFHEAIAALALEHKVHLFVGAATILPDTEPMKRFNSAFHYLPNGQQAVDTYSKIDRVPFGEYIPWVENWPWLKELFLAYLSPLGKDKDGKGKDYTLTPGDRRTVFEVVRESGDPLRVTVPICFEDAFARSCLALCYDRSGKRSDIMLNLTNDGWYPGTDQGLQHVQMAAIRSVENRVPMARSVNTGVSCFIDSNGRIVSIVEKDGLVQEIDGFTVYPMAIDARSTLFGSVGTLPVVLLMISMFILSAIAYAQRSRR